MSSGMGCMSSVLRCGRWIVGLSMWGQQIALMGWFMHLNVHFGDVCKTHTV